MRNCHFPSPAASRNHFSFLSASRRSSGRRTALLRCSAAAALVWSFLAPAAASACRRVTSLDTCFVQKAISANTVTNQGNDDQAKTEAPQQRHPESNSALSRFGLAFHASTLGLGGDAAFRLARPINLRVGVNAFHYSRSLTSDGVPYEGALRLRSMEAIVDWFPFSHGFHIGSGALFFNGNRVTAVATPPVGQILTSGEEAFISDPQNPLKGNAKSATHKIAPLALLGFGNLLPRNRHLAYSVDFGVVFQGAPKSTFMVGGGACDPSGEFCARAAENSSIQADAQSARRDLDHHVSFLKYYPVMSVEFGYRF